MNVWIVVVNFNGWDDTHKCLTSLEAQTHPATVVLVDNASRESRLAEITNAFPHVRQIPNPVNGGWAGGNNVGMRYAIEHGAEAVILLNNDTTVSPVLVERLVTAAKNHPSYGILGPVINFMDEPSIVQTDGVLFNHAGYNGFFERRPIPLETHAVPVVRDVEIVNGCCMMVRREVVRSIGLIDEQFFLIHEESDYCLRAREAGFGCGVFGESLVLHKGSSSFKRTGSRLQRYYDARNLYLLLNKHADIHAEGRGRVRSMGRYLKYVYYRYSHECETGTPDSANAVLEGVCDAVAERFGPMTQHERWGVPILRGVFNTVRKIR